jgi:hypothetical protein
MSLQPDEYFRPRRWERPMHFSNSAPKFAFTRLHAHIVEENGAFTVRVRMLNHLKQDQCACGEEIAPTIDRASSMIELLAKQFCISEKCVSIKIVMDEYKQGTFH